VKNIVKGLVCSAISMILCIYAFYPHTDKLHVIITMIIGVLMFSVGYLCENFERKDDDGV